MRLSVGPAKLTWNVEYIDSYKVFGADMLQFVKDSAIRQQGADGVIPSQIYHDFLLTYDFRGSNRGALSGLSLSLGVQNIFDELPPIVSYTPAAPYSFYGDPRMRRYSLRLGYEF